MVDLTHLLKVLNVFGPVCNMNCFHACVDLLRIIERCRDNMSVLCP